MRKLKVAQAYPELAPEVMAAIEGSFDDPILNDPAVRDRVKQMLGNLGLDAFRVEYFRKLPSAALCEEAPDSNPPFYETYGRLLVAAGRYREALRREMHVAPVAEALRRLAGGGGVAPEPAATEA